MRFIEIEQIGSPIRRESSQRATLVGLGLNRIGRVKWVPDTPASRGMIRKVSHLVRITHDPAAPKPPDVPPTYDEAADAALLRELIFDPNNIALEFYNPIERNAGKSPDFKLIKNGKVVAFCEMKSPKDDFVFERPKPGDRVIRENLPFYRKIAGHIRKAAKQFDAVNSDHSLPNILVFVSHAPDIQRRDLLMTITGLSAGDGRRIFMLSRKAQAETLEAARKIDLFLWIDAEKRTCQHLSTNDARHQQAALDLLDLKNTD
jgi:ribosomal protein L30